MKKIYLLLFICTIGLACCKKEPDRPPVPVNRTMMFYLAANNNLYDDARTNINSLLVGATKSALNGGRILIFYTPNVKNNDGNQRIIEIIVDNAGKSHEKVLTEYPGEQRKNSADPITLRFAIEEMRRLAPAESYGLNLWSHASGWLPALRVVPKSKAFAQDGSYWMETYAMSAAIPDGMFDYIIIDACNMGTVEVAYMLRDKTKYLIASPLEVLAYGMPYEKLVGHMFLSDDIRQASEKIAQTYFKFYAEEYNYHYASIAVYDCSKLGAFADATAAIMKKYSDKLATLDLSQQQLFDRDDVLSRSPHWMYDMRTIIRTITPLNDSENLLAKFETALNNVVIYKNTTDAMVTLPIDKEKYSGVGMYPLHGSMETHNYTAFYKTLDWYKKVYN